MNNILYINPLTVHITFLILGSTEITKKTLTKNMETSINFPKFLVDIVDEYNIHEIWCVTGPGPFTLMRIITLSINALTYTRDIKLKSCHFFDLIQNNNTPIIEANSREYLIRENNKTIHIKKDDLSHGCYEGIFSEILSTENIKYIQYEEDQYNIGSAFSKKTTINHISPIYFKPPHITCPIP